MAVSGTHNGWRWDRTNSRLDFYYRGTRVGRINSSGMNVVGDFGADTTVDAGTIITAGTDVRTTAGNFRAGTVSAFATTQPTAWLVMKSATQPSGAITTSGGIGANDTTVQKIIAAGTINNVET